MLDLNSYQEKKKLISDITASRLFESAGLGFFVLRGTQFCYEVLLSEWFAAQRWYLIEENKKDFTEITDFSLSDLLNSSKYSQELKERWIFHLDLFVKLK